MLQALSIRDFIIVDRLDLEFSQGYTALTGETGAGKSILIDALSLSLGARNEGDVTRAGCEKAEISTTFFIRENATAKAWLLDNEMDVTDELILRRVIYSDGRSRAFMNGATVTVSQLKVLGECLIDIYSQNAHHSLLKQSTQRDIVDDYAQSKELAQSVAKQYKVWHQLQTQRLELEKNAAVYAEELAELRDQSREIVKLAFTIEEWQDLQLEHHRLSHGASVLSGVETCIAMLNEGEPAALNLLTQAQTKLTHLIEFDSQLNEALDVVASATIQIEEAGRFLNRYLQRAELDPARLNEVESRIAAIHGMARKYRTKPETLPELLQTCQARMQVLAGFVDDGTLAKNEAQALQAYQALAKQLSQKRQAAAKTLSQKISQEMQRLSLTGGQFVVALTTCDAAATGLEHVEFLVAGHAGVEPKSLNKVASGGELSRISLALQVTTAAVGSVPCMIFDEVDVGIGGAVAEVVGQLLRQLGAQCQVLVITHLAQVAALAKQHMQVKKTQANGTTLSQIQLLGDTERVEEIARMLGGLNLTDTTRQHAREMLGFLI